MNYCMECGTKLIEKELKNEGMVPFCPSCNCFRFPIFSVAIISVIMNKTKDKVLLIKQYGKDRNVLVAGYVNKGENSESTLIREVKEELGLDICWYKYVKSEYFSNTNTLMLNYIGVVDNESLENTNSEVDFAQWYNFNDAKNNVAQNSLAQELLLNILNNKIYNSEGISIK